MRHLQKKKKLPLASMENQFFNSILSILSYYHLTKVNARSSSSDITILEQLMSSVSGLVSATAHPKATVVGLLLLHKKKANFLGSFIMNVDSILHFQAKNPEEDFYALLGCDPSSSVEQVTAEFKARVKDCHPDRNRDDQTQSQQKFQILLRVCTIFSQQLLSKVCDGFEWVMARCCAVPSRDAS